MQAFRHLRWFQLSAVRKKRRLLSPMMLATRILSIAAPGVHSDAGGHWQNNLGIQQLTLSTMIRFAQRNNVPLHARFRASQGGLADDISQPRSIAVSAALTNEGYSSMRKSLEGCFALLACMPLLGVTMSCSRDYSNTRDALAIYDGFTLMANPLFYKFVTGYEREEIAPVYVELNDGSRYLLSELPEEVAASILPKLVRVNADD